MGFGVVKGFTVGSVDIDTRISSNGYDRGRTILYLESSNGGSGGDTYSAIGMLRCGYNGNNLSKIIIAEQTGNVYINAVDFRSYFYVGSNGNIFIEKPKAVGSCYVTMLCNK